jgi:hypothetical protein
MNQDDQLQDELGVLRAENARLLSEVERFSEALAAATLDLQTLANCVPDEKWRNFASEARVRAQSRGCTPSG